MITSTHMLWGAALTTRPRFRPWHIAIGFVGGFLPDAPMFAMVLMARLDPQTGQNLWRRPDGLYWQDPWRSLADLGHSIPIWAGLALGAYLVWRRGGRWADLAFGLLILCGAALFHALCDFPVHTYDAHAQFLPFSGWRFHSPVSYYQPAHYGRIVSAFEIGLGTAAAVWMAVRYRQWPVRLLSLALALPYLMLLGLLFRHPPV